MPTMDLHPTPYTLHPTPCTLHRTPCTPHPAPYTQHPTTTHCARPRIRSTNLPRYLLFRLFVITLKPRVERHSPLAKRTSTADSKLTKVDELKPHTQHVKSFSHFKKVMKVLSITSNPPRPLLRRCLFGLTNLVRFALFCSGIDEFVPRA